ncbi:MAG: type II toxin-antitoxin system VapC family toxin [Candidatus Competibacteraceae bacterium]
MSVVLDASALLAYLHDEPGNEAVEKVLAGAMISTVNLAEVIQKAMARSVEVQGLRQDLEALGLDIIPFTATQAEGAARLWQRTRAFGLSLGDRACLSLGLELALPVLTADQEWRQLELGLEIQLIR